MRSTSTNASAQAGRLSSANELKATVKVLTQKMESHLNWMKELQEVGDGQKRAVSREAFIRAFGKHKAHADNLALQIIKLNKRIDELESGDVRIPVVFVTADQMAAVDETSDFAAGVAV